jgi:hypothetical protein
MALNNLSISTDKSGEPQNDILNDESLLLSSLSLLSWSFLWLPYLGLLSEANLDFSEDDDDLMIFGSSESLELTDALDVCFSMEDLPSWWSGTHFEDILVIRL